MVLGMMCSFFFNVVLISIQTSSSHDGAESDGEEEDAVNAHKMGTIIKLSFPSSSDHDLQELQEVSQTVMHEYNHDG
jgi:hypothetical protein